LEPSIADENCARKGESIFKMQPVERMGMKIHIKFQPYKYVFAGQTQNIQQVTAIGSTVNESSPALSYFMIVNEVDSIVK
jgi:hypothetical protein